MRFCQRSMHRKLPRDGREIAAQELDHLPLLGSTPRRPRLARARPPCRTSACCRAGASAAGRRQPVSPGTIVIVGPSAADAAAVDPRQPLMHGRVVEQIAGLEIVGAVEDRIHALAERLDIFRPDMGDDRLDFHRGVDRGRSLSAAANGLGQPGRHVGLVEKRSAGAGCSVRRNRDRPSRTLPTPARTSVSTRRLPSARSRRSVPGWRPGVAGPLRPAERNASARR